MDISTKDKQKPFILLAAIVFGVAIQYLVGRPIPWLLSVVEFGVFLVIVVVMLPIEIGDVGQALKKTLPTSLVLFINFIFIPLFTWWMGWLILREYPDLWVGAILYTLTPCIGWYLIFTDLAKGNVAWGVSLLPWNVTLQFLLMPVYLYLLVGHVIPIELYVLIRSIVLYFIAPIIIAYVLRKSIVAWRGRQYFEGPIKDRLGAIKLWSLVAVIICMFASQSSLSLSETGRLGALLIFLCAFFAILFIIAILAGKLFRLSYEDTVTLAFTTTARNPEVVIGVAVATFPGQPLVYLAIILGPIVELPILLLVSRVMLAQRGWLEVKKAGKLAEHVEAELPAEPR